jgi:diguanylate cyclase
MGRVRPRLAVQQSGWPRTAAVLLPLLILYIAWQVSGWPAGGRTLTADVFNWPVDFAALLTAWLASRRCARTPELRTAWRLLAMAFGTYLVGDITWTVYDAVGSDPFPSAADVFYLAFYPLMLWALLRIPARRRSFGESMRLSLDLAVVAIGGSAVVIYVVLGPTITQAGSDVLGTAISIAYPVGDVVLLVGLGSVLLRGCPRSSAVALRFVAVGLLMTVVADLLFGYLDLHDAYRVGDAVDTMYMFAMATFALAGAAQPRPDPAEQAAPQHQEKASWVPYVAVLLSFGMLCLAHFGDRWLPDKTILIAAVLVATLVSVRQFLAQRDLVATQARLSYQSLHDGLTGLPNRTLALDRAEQMLLRAARSFGEVAALYVDLDDFKHVNDSFGHAAGDELLQVVAKRLSGIVRASDTVARLAGDEFVVLVDNSTFDVGPELAAERIAAVLNQPVELRETGGRALSITASIGIAQMTHGAPDELIRQADFAMYEAKRRGKNRWTAFESTMQTVLSDRLALELDLKDALKADQFYVLYQPIVCLQSETITAVEALIRWRHPDRGTVSPATFIPLAEQTGQIVPIGIWVLRTACEQVAQWCERGSTIDVSVNVSSEQLDHEGFVGEVATILESTGVNPAALTLEITETALMRDSSTAARRLNELKELGVQIAVDDFGTGYSSLAYVRHLPVDALKIDRTFISGIAASRESQALVHTLVELGKTLGLQTVAEGIEDVEQLRRLQDEDCDFGQGFLFDRPIEPEAVERRLLEGRDAAASR